MDMYIQHTPIQKHRFFCFYFFFFLAIDRLILKYIWKYKGPRKVKFLKKKNKELLHYLLEKITLSLYCLGFAKS